MRLPFIARVSPGLTVWGYVGYSLVWVALVLAAAVAYKHVKQDPVPRTRLKRKGGDETAGQSEKVHAGDAPGCANEETKKLTKNRSGRNQGSLQAIKNQSQIGRKSFGGVSWAIWSVVVYVRNGDVRIVMSQKDFLIGTNLLHKFDF